MASARANECILNTRKQHYKFSLLLLHYTFWIKQRTYCYLVAFPPEFTDSLQLPFFFSDILQRKPVVKKEAGQTGGQKQWGDLDLTHAGGMRLGAVSPAESGCWAVRTWASTRELRTQRAWASTGTTCCAQSPVLGWHIKYIYVAVSKGGEFFQKTKNSFLACKLKMGLVLFCFYNLRKAMRLSGKICT